MESKNGIDPYWVEAEELIFDGIKQGVVTNAQVFDIGSRMKDMAHAALIKAHDECGGSDELLRRWHDEINAIDELRWAIKILCFMLRAERKQAGECASI